MREERKGRSEGTIEGTTRMANACERELRLRNGDCHVGERQIEEREAVRAGDARQSRGRRG